MLTLIDKDLERSEFLGECPASFKEREEAATAIEKFLNSHSLPIVAQYGAAACENEDHLIGVLSSEVTDFLDREITPRRPRWGYILDERVNDLIQSRLNALALRCIELRQKRSAQKRVVKTLVEEVLEGMKREQNHLLDADDDDDDEEEEANLVEPKTKQRRTLFEVSDLDSEDEKEGNDEDEDDEETQKPERAKDDSSDDDDDDVSFKDGTQLFQRKVEVNKAANVTTVETTTFTIGKAKVDQEIARLVKENGGNEVELAKIMDDHEDEHEDEQTKTKTPPPTPRKPKKVICIDEHGVHEETVTPLHAASFKSKKH